MSSATPALSSDKSTTMSSYEEYVPPAITINAAYVSSKAKWTADELSQMEMICQRADERHNYTLREILEVTQELLSSCGSADLDKSDINARYERADAITQVALCAQHLAHQRLYHISAKLVPSSDDTKLTETEKVAYNNWHIMLVALYSACAALGLHKMPVCETVTSESRSVRVCYAPRLRIHFISERNRPIIYVFIGSAQMGEKKSLMVVFPNGKLVSEHDLFKEKSIDADETYQARASRFIQAVYKTLDAHTLYHEA
jgi:hypothetical protein